MRQLEAAQERHVRTLQQKCDQGDVWVTMKELEEWFPEAPKNQLARMVIPKGVDMAALPFNRHKRRRIQRAKWVVLHLFSGENPGWWEKRLPQGTELLEVDVLTGQDMLDDNLLSYVLHVAKTGRLMMGLAGPPCRTVSVCL